MRPSAVFSALVLSTLVAAQNNQNTIEFESAEAFDDLRRCLKGVFVFDYLINGGDTVDREIGCETNECICRPDTLQEAVSTAGLLAQSACSNSVDRSLATSFLTQYCIDKVGTAGVPVPTNNAGSGSVTPVSVPSSPTPIIETKNVVSTVSGSAVTIFSTVTTMPNETSPPQTANNEPAKSTSNIGAIAGGVVGGLVVIGAIVGFFIWFLRKRRDDSDSAAEQGSPPTYEKDYQSNQLGGMEMHTREVGGIQTYGGRP